MTYKECPKVLIGESDVAKLVMVGCGAQNGLKSELLHLVVTVVIMRILCMIEKSPSLSIIKR